MKRDGKIRKAGWFGAAVALSAVIVCPGRVGAQSAPSAAELRREVAELKLKVEHLEAENQQLKELSRQVNALSGRLGVQEETAKRSEEAAKRSAEAYEQTKEVSQKLPIVRADSEGFFIRSHDDTYQLRVGGYVQADGDFYLSQTKPTGSQFLMRRVRPFLEGTVAEYYDFRFMEDFGQGTSVLQDAYTDIHYWPEFRIRVGKFKEPVGLERLEEARNLKFVERALTVDLVPNRDLGAEFWGDLLSHRVEYEAGVFNGVPDNTASVDSDNNDAKEFDGRIFLHPFAETSLQFAEKLGLGIAGTYGDERGSTIDSYKTTGQFTFFTYNQPPSKQPKGVTVLSTVAAGPRYRYTPQLNYYWGPFGLLAEYVENSQKLYGGEVPAIKKPPLITDHTLSNQAWQVATTYLLTGENASYGEVRPRSDFRPFGGSGAWELAARIDRLTIDRDAFKYDLASPSTSSLEATEFALGVNWYLNRNVKWMVDYEHTGFRYGNTPTKTGGNRDRPDESAILSEVQFQF
ncbi:MAG: porin [Candidatus Binataceae bacterium]